MLGPALEAAGHELGRRRASADGCDAMVDFTAAGRGRRRTSAPRSSGRSVRRRHERLGPGARSTSARASAALPVFFAPNFAIGAVLMMRFAARGGAALRRGRDHRAAPRDEARRAVRDGAGDRGADRRRRADPLGAAPGPRRPPGGILGGPAAERSRSGTTRARARRSCPGCCWRSSACRRCRRARRCPASSACSDEEVARIAARRREVLPHHVRATPRLVGSTRRRALDEFLPVMRRPRRVPVPRRRAPADGAARRRRRTADLGSAGSRSAVLLAAAARAASERHGWLATGRLRAASSCTRPPYGPAWARRPRLAAFDGRFDLVLAADLSTSDERRPLLELLPRLAPGDRARGARGRMPPRSSRAARSRAGQELALAAQYNAARCSGDVLTAIVTPFRRDGVVDFDAFQPSPTPRRNGSDGVVVAGHDRREPDARRRRALDLFRAGVEAVGDRATVVAGTGTYSTAHSVQLTERAHELGVGRVPRRHAVLQQAAAARDRRAFRGDRRRASDRRRRLQHPEPRHREHRAGDDLAARGDPERQAPSSRRTRASTRPGTSSSSASTCTRATTTLLPFLGLGGPVGVCVHTHLVGPQVTEHGAPLRKGDLRARARDRRASSRPPTSC